jgi:hypothetical protein
MSKPEEPNREPIEPPGGFSPKLRPDDLSASAPEWLIGTDDRVDRGSPHERRTERPTLLRPGAPPERRADSPALRLAVPAPPSEPEVEEPLEPMAEAWAPAASSIPKLSVVPQRKPVAREAVVEDELASVDPLADDEDGEGESPGSEASGETIPVAPEDPWWLVAVETLATNRMLQIGIAAALVALAAWILWPRKENQTVAIATIKQQPQRFEGQAVRIRGEVGEVFDVGSGVVFELHQRRDTLVVFSPSRRPAVHDKVLIQGTVSTGYLDGLPRVALFEAPGAPAR